MQGSSCHGCFIHIAEAEWTILHRLFPDVVLEDRWFCLSCRSSRNWDRHLLQRYREEEDVALKDRPFRCNFCSMSYSVEVFMKLHTKYCRRPTVLGTTVASVAADPDTKKICEVESILDHCWDEEKSQWMFHVKWKLSDKTDGLAETWEPIASFVDFDENGQWSNVTDIWGKYIEANNLNLWL